jgi:hypothetical protein
VAGFADVVPVSQGALFIVKRCVQVATATFDRGFRLRDTGRNPIDLSDVTFACEVLDPDDLDTVVLTIDATGDDAGVLRLTLPAAEVPLSLATRRAGATYPWRLVATAPGSGPGASAVVAVLWSSAQSSITFIRP